MRGTNTKPKLDRVGIFGANAHIGLEIARKIKAQAQETSLKLIVRSENHRPALEQEFPDDEVVLANYYDLPSLEVALAGLKGLFIVTPDFLDEERAMTNLVYAARASRGIMHIVRLLADPPGMTYERVPNALRNYSIGFATQHLRAKVILENSGLPITYTNIASAFMQNFMRFITRPCVRNGFWRYPVTDARALLTQPISLLVWQRSFYRRTNVIPARPITSTMVTM